MTTGTAKSVKVVSFSDSPRQGYDVADWIANDERNPAKEMEVAA